jgi:hypothetical protein
LEALIFRGCTPETTLLHGVWVAEVYVKPKGASKKKRTFDEPEFHLFTEIEGRFVDLLPRKFGHGPTGTLH